MKIYSQSKIRKMIKFLALVTLTALASAATLSKDLPRGFPWSPSSGRVVGGEDTTIEEVPYQVSLRSGNSHSCGGSIISESWIVTAAHCVGGSLKSYTVYAGSTNKYVNGSLHTVAEIFAHENYDMSMQGVPCNDIAVIRVNEPFELDEKRQPIGLFNNDEETPVGVHAVITGWGRTGSGSSPSILQIVEVPTISKKECDEAYIGFGGLPVGQICTALPEGGKDSCKGDSGGPLVVNGLLAGIVSWGNGCAAPGWPGVYTEISHYRKWIKINSGV